MARGAAQPSVAVKPIHNPYLKPGKHSKPQPDDSDSVSSRPAKKPCLKPPKFASSPHPQPPSSSPRRCCNCTSKGCCRDRRCGCRKSNVVCTHCIDDCKNLEAPTLFCSPTLEQPSLPVVDDGLATALEDVSAASSVGNQSTTPSIGGLDGRESPNFSEPPDFVSPDANDGLEQKLAS
eukprot:scaffold2640_cov86-Cylindrotheca_fusiformis.AAC.1